MGSCGVPLGSWSLTSPAPPQEADDYVHGLLGGSFGLLGALSPVPPWVLLGFINVP